MPIELWFEFASTYSYLAVHQYPRHDAPFVLRPFLLGPIFAAQGWSTSPFNLYPAKGRYMWRDLERLCEAAGLPFRRPSEFPRSGLTAARIALAHEDAPWMPGFVRGVYRANFAEDRPIQEPSVLDEVAGSVGQDGRALRAAAEAPAVKAALKERTARAVDLGIFGAPTFVVGTELFWGADRLEQAVAWWRGDAGLSAPGRTRSPR
jgi:2-hydroxychromene-2-carboxylate isomerase